MTFGDWLALAAIAAPLICKAMSDWNANAVANHNLRLARITGMAGREAATIARALAGLPPNASAKDAEQALLSSSVESIMTEMGSSSTAIGADSTKVATILQGELDKFIAPNATAVVPAISGATP